MLSEILTTLNSFLWGKILLPLMIGIGIFLSLLLGFPQIKNFFASFYLTVGKMFSNRNRTNQNFSVWESASTALASTIGTGSIFGVAVAIKAGGAGTLFWMWVSAFLGMAIKYVEIILAFLYRNKNSDGSFFGGPMFYLKNGVGSRFLATFFSVFCLLVSLCMGNSVQSNAITAVLKNRLGLNIYFSGAVLAILVGFVVLGGTRRIASFNAKLVPFMSILYVSSCIVILFLRCASLPAVFSKIFQEAFCPSSFSAGVSSYCLLEGMRNGFAKGIFSNEAGLGSAPIAHASSSSDDAIEQGAWGIFEVFFTTMVICTLTALVVLSYDSFLGSDLNSADLLHRSFEDDLPCFGGNLVVLSTVLFSLSTIFGWAYYGEFCLRFLFKNPKKFSIVYRFVYVLVTFFGAVLCVDLIWSLSEIMNALMAIPNLIGIVLLSGKVKSFLQKTI